MEIQNQFTKMKNLQQKMLEFIDKEDNIEENFQNLIKIIEEQNISKDCSEFTLFLRLIMAIADDHYRSSGFFDKIEQILQKYKSEIQQFFTNKELFSLFKTNKRILLFLVQQNMITFDEKILDKILIKSKYRQSNYLHYFEPEVKQAIEKAKNDDNKVDNKDEEEEEEEVDSYEIPKDFYEKRLIGENDSYVCNMIRNDLISDFIIFVNKESYSLNSKIEESIYETNRFLLYETPTMIEYAAFFGSTQIFNYLFKNNVEITPSVWRYAVHSDNPEMINILEENSIKLDNGNNDNESFPYKSTILEAIACHNNDVADYIMDKYKEEESKKPEDKTLKYTLNKHITSYCFKYYNFNYFPENIKDKSIFFYFCIYDYYNLVKIFLSRHRIDINNLKISKVYKFE